VLILCVFVAQGTVGGGFACFLYERQFLPEDLDEDDRKLLVLSGMAAAIGALFPSPILTVMMIFELGHPPRSTMESVTILSFASCVSFIVYYAVIGDGKSWLMPITDGGKFVSSSYVHMTVACFIIRTFCMNAVVLRLGL
jgi:H+/Cl- antiporter ClcA